MKIPASQSWIHSPLTDTLFILAPGILSSLGVLYFRDFLGDTAGIPLWAWVIFVLCVDVAHVYSTLFRTYLDQTQLRENGTLLTLTPLLAWLAGVFLYSIDALLFWSALAYLAVFHFIRQQYGFLMLYCRNCVPEVVKYLWVDRMLLYLSMIYPLIHWHVNLPKNFTWFVQGDFVGFLPPILEPISLMLYLLALLAYGIKEIYLRTKGHAFLIPKQLVLTGTALSWYAGIVLFNGDMAFTITNVLSHGIPYMALIWMFGNRRARTASIEKRSGSGMIFKPILLPAFIGALLLAAFLEEGLWAGFVWREHLEFFKIFSSLPKIEDRATLCWLIPLLSLPQSTHYILDGFIWRLRNSEDTWKNTLFAVEERGIL
jgi:hypothetical protein